MIQADDLSLAYGGQTVLDGAAFSLQKGERCGLVGRNGSGKSTLFRLLAKAEEPDRGRIVTPKGYRVGVLRQQIRLSQPTILQEAALGLADPNLLYQVESILFGLGFSQEMMDAPPEVLSGGYQLRLELAKVLASEPDCLLLDEPTNYLDILSVRFLSKLLQKWPKEMILISHDLQFLDQTTTHMMALHRHKMYKIKGKSGDIFHLIAEEEERHERVRANVEKKKAHLQEFIDRFGAKATKAVQAQSKQKMLAKLPDLERLKNLAQLDFRFHEVPFHGKKMCEAIRLCFGYDDPLITNFSLAIEKGERIAIVGKNGYGKSTLLKLLIGEIKPQQGEMTVAPAARIGYFGQTHIDRLNPAVRVEEEIASANLTLNFTQVRAICGLMMFGGDAAKKPISVLSGGEKSRVLLGKIIAQPCNLLCLDEPTHHLDIESIEALIDAIEEFEGAVVMVTHSEWVLRRIPFDKLIVCHRDAQEIFAGSYDEFLTKVGWQEEEKGAEKGGEKAKKGPEEREKVKKGNKWQIEKCEKEISALEIGMHQNQEKLAAISPTGRGDEIKKLLADIALQQQQIEALYNKLDQLY